MSLKEFLEAFKVRSPYYLRELHNGVGQKFLIYNDDFIRNIKKESKWMIASVTRVGVCVHTSLGALLEVDIDV